MEDSTKAIIGIILAAILAFWTYAFFNRANVDFQLMAPNDRIINAVGLYPFYIPFVLTVRNRGGTDVDLIITITVVNGTIMQTDIGKPGVSYPTNSDVQYRYTLFANMQSSFSFNGNFISNESDNGFMVTYSFYLQDIHSLSGLLNHLGCFDHHQFGHTSVTYIKIGEGQYVLKD